MSELTEIPRSNFEPEISFRFSAKWSSKSVSGGSNQDLFARRLMYLPSLGDAVPGIYKRPAQNPFVSTFSNPGGDPYSPFSEQHFLQISFRIVAGSWSKTLYHGL